MQARSLFILSAMALGLAACGGGGSTTTAPTSPAPSGGSGGTGSGTGTGTGTGTGSSNPNYPGFDSSVASTSTLAGTALIFPTTGGGVTLVTTSGSLTHNSDATTVNIAGGQVGDPDGVGSGTTLSDGAGNALTLTGLADTYDFLRVYDGTVIDGATTYTVDVVVAGTPTQTADMPTSNTATYTGAAEALVAISGGQSASLENGRAVLSVDFGNGLVDVELDSFTARDVASGNLVTAPLTDIFIDNMVISGNTFSGGTLRTQLSGAAVDVLGSGATLSAAGTFFGIDESGTFDKPDETGGVFYTSGATGEIDGSFVGD